MASDEVVLTTQRSSLSKYVNIAILVVLVASLGTNAIFMKTYFDLKRGDAEREQIIKDQKESINKQNEVIEGLNFQIADLGKKIADLDQKKKVIDQKKKDDKIHYSKPLPKPEEDKFFADNGFMGTRTGDSGRFFTNDDVIKVQLLVTENANLRAELDLAYDKIGTQNTMIETYKAKCLSQEQIIKNYEMIEEQRQKEIQKYRLEVAQNKVYKWAAIIVGGALVGYAAAK